MPTNNLSAADNCAETKMIKKFKYFSRERQRNRRGAVGDGEEDCVCGGGEGKLIKIFEFQIDDMAH